MNYKKCIICNNIFIPKVGNQICCSKECSIINKKNINNKHMIKYRKYSKEIRKIYDKNRYKNNREEIIKKSLLYYKNNKENILQKRKEYYIENKDKIKRKIKKYHYNRLINDIEYKIKCILRTQICHRLKSKKDFKTFDILNYTTKELKLHLESLFKDGMNWDNYGLQWHIDHIKPCASFIFINNDNTLNYNAIKEYWSLSNLQPLWIEDNIKKCAWYEINGIFYRYSKGKIVEVKGEN